jgi:hypothetical protein
MEAAALGTLASSPALLIRETRTVGSHAGEDASVPRAAASISHDWFGIVSVLSLFSGLKEFL